MASKLKIIPLGGLGEIGKNLTIYEYGKDMFLVDCGMGFPDQDLYGVDLVIPDISYLKANKNRIRGMVITHGHEDHIGAIPYVLKQLDMPIYATPLTAAIIELRLEEHDLLYHTQGAPHTGGKFRNVIPYSPFCPLAPGKSCAILLLGGVSTCPSEIKE